MLNLIRNSSLDIKDTTLGSQKLILRSIDMTFANESCGQNNSRYKWLSLRVIHKSDIIDFSMTTINMISIPIIKLF